MDAKSSSRRQSPFGLALVAALLAGATLALRLPALPSAGWMWVGAGVGLMGWLFGRRMALRVPAALLAGFMWCGLHAAWALALQLPVEHERADLELTGRVVQLPEHDADRTRFMFRVDRSAENPEFLQGRVLRLSWYDGWGQEASRRGEIEPGSGWRFTARVRAPRGLRNPGWFDGEKQALSRRIAAIGYVRDRDPVKRLGDARGMDAWRDAMATRIDRAVASESSRYVRALALGDTRQLAEGDWEALRATGLTHLIAISGFHVGLVAGFFALIAAGIWKLLPGLGRWLPRPQAAAIVALAGSLVYAAVAGWELPTVRTVLMIGVVVVARLSRRSLRVADSLALAAVAIVLVDPLSLLTAGFWLSFAGVAWLVWCLPRVAEQRLVSGFLGAQWVATLGLLPLTAVLFGQASLAGPLANLVAIPWWSLVVVPLSLLGTGLEAVNPGWGGWAWRLAAWCFDLSWPLFGWLAESRFSLWWLPEARWVALPLALIGAFWLLLPRGVPGKPLAALLWLPLLWPDRELPRHGEAELVVLDVGQGLSVLIRTANHAYLYDMGPAVPDGYDAGERVVVPALLALGVRRLDGAFVSHGDADHAGGLGAVMRRFPTRALFAPHGSPVEAAPCLATTAWEADGVRFSFLHPTMHFPYLGNEASCVLRVETDHGAALLTGDVGHVVEREMTRRDPQSVRADLVLMGHHGSRGSSDPMFVAATGASHALVSAGYGNRFGHPDGGAVQRWQEAGAQVLSTATGGALRLRLAEGGVVAEQRRLARRRLWDADHRLAATSSTEEEQ
ncbi:DNA internalization-related competence protein ComEC/Rec2 [Luteimonas sp. A277]